ncbi:MAG: helix-turn-helix domain-containing protein [Candidatus Aenigmatarchaeota archaeon]
MLKESIVKDLKEFGLSEYEAKAYLALTIHGPLSASSVSEISSVPQSKVYGVLKSLVSKSLAEYWNGKPLKYKAVEPLIALKKMFNQKKNNIETLKEKTKNLIKELKPFKENGFGLWSSKGKIACLEKAAEMISRAKKFGFAITSHFSRHPSLDDAYVNALKRGVKIKMLGTSALDDAKRARASWYLKQGAEIRILPMSIQTTLGIIDNKEVCIRIDNNSLDSDVVWSNNPALVNIFKTYFNELWVRAKKFKLAY